MAADNAMTARYSITKGRIETNYYETHAKTKEFDDDEPIEQKHLL